MAATQKRTPCLRLLLSVTQAEDEHRVVEVLQKNGIPLCFEARAKGTAPSELLDAIGLGGTTRVLTAFGNCRIFPGTSGDADQLCGRICTGGRF